MRLGSLKLREEYRLNMFDNTVRWKIFVLESDDVPGYWRRLHYEELNDLYCSSNINRVIRSGG